MTETKPTTEAELRAAFELPIEMIFVDLDGVLADFVHGALNLFHRPPAEVMAGWKPGNYFIGDALGMDREAFWDRLSGNHKFWHCLNPTPDWRLLLKTARTMSAEIRICTAPSSCSTSHYGKAKWLRHHGLDPGAECIMTQDKHLLAGPRRVLIDDSDENCERFEQAGGHAIVWPQLWNSHHALRKQPRVPYVSRHLETISDVIAAGEVSE